MRGLVLIRRTWYETKCWRIMGDAGGILEENFAAEGDRN
jgi:hypothetical protein